MPRTRTGPGAGSGSRARGCGACAWRRFAVRPAIVPYGNGIAAAPGGRSTSIRRSASCPTTKTRIKIRSGKRVQPHPTRAQRRSDGNTRQQNGENATREPARPTCAVLCAASRRERISPAKVPVTGQAGRSCAPLDRANPPRSLAKKWLWISYPLVWVPLRTSAIPFRSKTDLAMNTLGNL